MKGEGIKPLDTLTIYPYGVVRLPADFGKDTRVAVRFERKELKIFPAENGELGLKPQRSKGARGLVIDLNRVFRNANLDPTKIAGEYKPEITEGVLKVKIGGGKAYGK